MNTGSYGSWKSPITSDLIVAQTIGLSEVRIDGEDIYWLESRPHEAGRCVVVRYVAGSSFNEDINPEPFNVRSRVHEYGGGAWTVSAGTTYFSNYSDGRLFRMERGGHWPYPLTPEGSFRYADGIIDTRRRRWVGVREDHSGGPESEQREPVNTLVWIDIDHGTFGFDGESTGGIVLASGHDFYSSPQLSPDGRWLAFLAWDHPNMPWTGTGLYVMQLDANGMPVGEPLMVAGGERESIFQPSWAPDGSALFFVSDRSGWWNLYRQKSRMPVEPLAPMDAEFGQPQWVFGMSTYAFAGNAHVVCSYVSGERSFGTLAGNRSSVGIALTTLDVPWTDFSSVRAKGSRVVFRGSSASKPGSIVLLNADTGATDVLKQSTNVADDAELAKYFTQVEPIEFPTSDGKTAFGLYYPAANPDYTAPESERPPLLVKCHGGPTSSATGSLDLRIQYWTSRGIAVLDVNYGGSTGYGREYRGRLDGNWGIVDVEDCVNGARFLAEQGKVDGHRIA